MRNLWLLFVVGLATGFISEKLLVSSQSPSSTADDLYLEGRTSGDFPIDDEDGDDDGSGSGSGDNFFRDAEEMLKKFLSDTIFNKDVLSGQPQPTESSHHNPPTTAADSENPPTTEEPTETTPLFPGEEVPGETTDSWFVHGASPSSTSPPSSETMTTKFSKDISVTKDADKDNELDDSTDKVIEEDIVRQDVNEVLAVDDRGRKTYDVADPEQVTSENMWERTEVLAAVIACGVVGFLCAVFLLLLLAYRMKKKDEGSYDLGDNKPSATAYQKAPTKEFYA